MVIDGNLETMVFRDENLSGINENDDWIIQNIRGDENVIIGRDNNGYICISDKHKLQTVLTKIKYLKELLAEKERLINVLLNK